MKMRRLEGSSLVIAVVNLITLTISIPLLAGGIYLSVQANRTDCLHFLQWPILGIALSLLLLSLLSLAGVFLHQTWLLRIYLFLVFILIFLLFGFIVFAFAVTDRGRGQAVVGAGFLEYRLEDYFGWLKGKVDDEGYWRGIRVCLRDGGACKDMPKNGRDLRTGMVVPETPEMFYRRDLTPIQSGCCKPPLSCGFGYIKETLWSPSNSSASSDPDCTRWSNNQRQLCYDCDSCKAGVLATVKHSWRKASIINIVVLIVLVIVYIVGCAAFRNSKRDDNDEPYRESRMTKSRPTRFQF